MNVFLIRNTDIKMHAIAKKFEHRVTPTLSLHPPQTIAVMQPISSTTRQTDLTAYNNDKY